MPVSWLERFGSLEVWSAKCPVCHGDTYIELLTDGWISPFQGVESQRCPCWYLYASMQPLWSGGYPKGYLNLNFDSSYPMHQMPPDVVQRWQELFPDSHAWEMSDSDWTALQNWVRVDTTAKWGLSLIIRGDKGTGKSALATALAKEFVKRRGLDSCGVLTQFSVQWLSADSLHADMGRGWRAKNVIGPCMDADVLVVDDLRMAYKGFTAVEYVERLHALLQHRAANSLPTIITVNKIAQGQDHQSNAITEFLGVESDSIPEAFGKYRYVLLTNDAIRPVSEWSMING